MSKMAVTIVSFRWLEILEKEFDKNFVDLDLLIGDLDAEEPDFVYSARQKLAGLSSCFAQLTHKAQTIFQNSAKVEFLTQCMWMIELNHCLPTGIQSSKAELLDLRTELVNSKTRQEILEEESRSLVLQLHSLQLDRLPSNQNPEQYKEKIETALKLSPSKSPYSEEITFRNNSEIKKLKNELLQYQSENIILRNSILALHSEVYGARLAAKYLDKELAGRIQQLQLLGREMRAEVRDKLWRQLESEILLHRHKTVIRACRNRTNHEFIQSDSRIFNFGYTDRRCLKHESNRRPSNTSSDFGTGNRDVGNGKNMKSEIPLGHVRLEELNRNNFNKNSQFVNEKNKENVFKFSKEDSDVIKNSENNSDILNKSPENSCTEEKEGLQLSENKRRDSIEKTDEEKPEGEDSLKLALKEDKKPNESTDGEDFLCVVGEKRTVIVKRKPGQGLGISITGGREHGVPILISELEVGGPAHECKNLYVGDAILKVNDISLENASHFEAVKILTHLETPDVKLLVQFIAVDTDEENSLSEDLYGYRYRFFDTEVMDSSDALGLHPIHSNSAHTPTAPRTPDYARNDKFNRTKDQNGKEDYNEYNSSSLSENLYNKSSETQPESTSSVEAQTLIDIDSEIQKEETDPLGLFRFQNQNETNYQKESLLGDFLVKKSDDDIKTETADLIQIEVTDPKPPVVEKKYEYVDENIFSGLEDNSLLDNIIKSFSEDDFSYLDTEKEKNATSDSGLEVCHSGSDADIDKVFPDERFTENDCVDDWVNNTSDKVEVKTLQQIFDRSFSSNLSSPRGSTSFDDDILSTEQSDEKSNSVSNFRNKTKEFKNSCSGKKIQKVYPKSLDLNEEILKRSLNENDQLLVTLKCDLVNGKKTKRCGTEAVKRVKPSRKQREKKNSKESDDLPKINDLHKKRELNYKINQIDTVEYIIADDIDRLSPINIENCRKVIESCKKAGKKENSDDIEETKQWPRKYVLMIPGKGVKSDPNNSVETETSDGNITTLESHFKYFRPTLDGSLQVSEKENPKSKVYRCSRYESFGDPDFGTPV